MSDVKPALSREDWEARQMGRPPFAFTTDRGGDVNLGGGTWVGDPEACHGIAALCLVNQPFGFWPELPETLRIAAEKLRVLTDDPEAWGDLDMAADRIEALLPPEGTMRETKENGDVYVDGVKVATHVPGLRELLKRLIESHRVHGESHIERAVKDAAREWGDKE